MEQKKGTLAKRNGRRNVFLFFYLGLLLEECSSLNIADHSLAKAYGILYEAEEERIGRTITELANEPKNLNRPR